MRPEANGPGWLRPRCPVDPAGGRLWLLLALLQIPPPPPAAAAVGRAPGAPRGDPRPGAVEALGAGRPAPGRGQGGRGRPGGPRAGRGPGRRRLVPVRPPARGRPGPPKGLANVEVGRGRRLAGRAGGDPVRGGRGPLRAGRARPPRAPRRRSPSPTSASGRVIDRQPDHAEARRLLGFLPREGGWATPYAADMLARGKVSDPTYGWVPGDWVPHLKQRRAARPAGSKPLAPRRRGRRPPPRLGQRLGDRDRALPDLRPTCRWTRRSPSAASWRRSTSSSSP